MDYIETLRRTIVLLQYQCAIIRAEINRAHALDHDCLQWHEVYERAVNTLDRALSLWRRIHRRLDSPDPEAVVRAALMEIEGRVDA